MLDYTIGQWSKDPVTQQTQYKYYITWIFSIAAGAALMKFLAKLFTLTTSVRMSKNVHAQMIKRVMCAPINLFYDVTPIGQILNRFSSDLAYVDDTVALNYSGILEMFVNVLQILTVVSLTNLYIVTVVPFILLIMLCLIISVVPAWKEMFRIAAVCRSPLLTQMTEVAEGGSTIKAFNREDRFISDNYVYLNSTILA